MADYSELKQNIASVIKSNNRREITGQILQNVLNQMVGSLGENYQLAGFAEPTTNPQQPDQTLFYIAEQAGVYTNFDNITLGDGLSFLMWKNSEWTSHTIGVATHSWVDSNYVSKAFLRQIFRVYDADGFEILPNDTTSIADNIKAMVGLWTNEYLSALGLGDDGQTGARYLTQLGDVNIDNETLANGQVLVYDNGLWVNGQAGGVDMSVVWAALAGNTNEQINASHLTTALTGYVTSSSLSTTLADYVTTTALSTALASYASQSWVSQNYVSIAFLNRILRAYDSTDTQVQPNDTTTAIDNLKAMVGLWTEQYLSALGQGNDGGGGGYITTLGQLEDVTLTTPSVGQALIYAEVESGVYKWVNGTAGVDMSSVWTALAGSTNEQIALSHLTTALSGYVTTGGLSTTLADYVTATALSTTLADYVTATSLSTTLASYATQQWVGQNYVSIAFFNRLFAAYDSSNVIINPNDTTTAVDNIKALVGLWTQQYISALGQGSDGGGGGQGDVTWALLADDTDTRQIALSHLTTALTGYATTSQLASYLPLSGGTISGGITPNADSTINLGTATAKYHYIYAHRLIRLQSIAKGDTYDSYKLDLPDKSGTIAVTSDIPTNNNQLTNGAGYVTSSGVTSVATGTGLTGGTITSTGTISIDSTYQTYISHGESAYNSLGNYLLLSGGTLTGSLNIGSGTANAYLNLNRYTDGGIIFKKSGTNKWQLVDTDDNGFNFWSYTANRSVLYISSYGRITAGGFSVSGTMASQVYNSSNDTPFIVRSGSPSCYIQFNNGSDNTLGWFGYGGTDGAYPSVYYNNVRYDIIHSGNIGSQSVNYATSAGSASTATSASTAGTASYANALSTARTLWGNSFNGTANIDGTIISASQKFWIGGDTLGMYLEDDSHTGIRLQYARNSDYTGYQVLNIGTVLRYKSSSSEADLELYLSDSNRSQISHSSNGLIFFINDGTWRSPMIITRAASPLVGIGTLSPSYQLHVAGDIYATGGVTSLSDIRKKDVISYDLPLSVEQIANAPTIKFLWKDKREEGEQVGTIAQYWQSVLPEVVKDKSGELSMGYGVTALIAATIDARKIVDHEKRLDEQEALIREQGIKIGELQNECAELRRENEMLKLKIA